MNILINYAVCQKSYDSNTHTLTLSGVATGTQYADALKTVKYKHSLMTDVLQVSRESLIQDR